MKKLFPYLLVLSIIFTSCSKDDDSNTDDPDSEPVSELIITATETCLLSDFDIQENSTVTINCLLDLEGQTVTIPSGVTFEFDGGDIFNGTLDFTSSGKMDGELLNSELIIEGDVALINEVFQFYPNRWAITLTNSSNPTPPSQSEAYTNHINIQATIDLVKKMGATDFNIGTMDAYFDSENRSAPIMLLPSDFSLNMTDKTTLRIFPIDADYSYFMLRITNVDNVTVSGGNLIGDRLEHGPTEGTNSLFWITASRNIIVENMHMSMAATGLSVNSFSWYDFEDQVARPYIPSEDIIIRNNTFDSNQSNNLSVTDGRNILIEGNKSYRVGNDLQNTYYLSEGFAPRIGILLEPAFDGVGFTQRVENVTIKDNIVDESRTNSILALGAINTIMDGNTVDATIGWTSADGVEVTNNTILGGGITGGFNGDTPERKSRENIIADNTITDAGTAMFLTSDDIKVYNNTITNCDVAFQIQNLSDSEIYDNNITSNKSGTIGFIFQESGNNVTIRDNEMTLTDGFALNILSINDDEGHEDYITSFKDNMFNTSSNARVNNSKNIEFISNEFINAGVGFANSSDMLFQLNTIDSRTGSALGINRGTGSSQNIQVIDNTIANTGGNRLEGYGVRVNTVGSDNIIEESNVVITGNTISSLGENYGLHVTDFDGMTIDNNTIETVSTNREPLYFIGNDSEITNNTIKNTAFSEVLIQGNNNTVSGN